MSHSINYDSEFLPVPEISLIFNLQFQVNIQREAIEKECYEEMYQPPEDRDLLMSLITILKQIFKVRYVNNTQKCRFLKKEKNNFQSKAKMKRC